MNSAKPAFMGPYAILLTPFTPGGEVDRDEYCRQVERLCASEITGLVACGSTGEFTSLTPDENIELMRLTARAARGRKPLVGGATAADTATSLRYLAAMAGLGYQGALAAPPYYFPLDDGQVEAYYRALSDAETGVPVVAYHIPQFTSPISLPVFEKLLHMPGVAGLKNSSGSASQFMAQLYLRGRARPGFALLSGSDECLLPYLAAGADGSFTAGAGIFPALVWELYREMAKGGGPAAVRYQMRIVQLVQIAARAPFPAGYKLLAQAMAGFCSGPLRQPLAPARAAALQEEIFALYSAYTEEHP